MTGKRPTGDAVALAMYKMRREGRFGAEPGELSKNAHWRKDSFLHLVDTIWPNAVILSDTEPEEPDPGMFVVH